MPWPDDLTAELPAPRDDEPPGLRAQIVKELRDHLQCALHRELVSTGSETEALKRVREKFGDPARLARKLWLDAMWGKIMTQRMMLVALVLVTLVSFGSMGLSWFLLDQVRQSNSAMLEQNRAANESLAATGRAANQALLEQNQQANEALLVRLAALAPGGTTVTSMEWNPLKVRVFVERVERGAGLGALVERLGGAVAAFEVMRAQGQLTPEVEQFIRQAGGPERAYGIWKKEQANAGTRVPDAFSASDKTVREIKPASGFEVKLRGHLLDTAKEMILARKSGADGTVDFGLVRPGRHGLTVTTPWGETSSVKSITVLPGEAQTVDINCPAPLEVVEISLSVEWPGDLAAQGLWLVCDLTRPLREFGDLTWTIAADGGRQFVAIDPAGGLINFNRAMNARVTPQVDRGRDPDRLPELNLDEDSFFRAGTIRQSPALGIFRLSSPLGGLGPSVPRGAYVGLPTLDRLPRLTWPAGTYRIGHLAVGKDPASGADNFFPDDMLHPLFLGGIEVHPRDDGRAPVTILEFDISQRLRRGAARRQAGLPAVPQIDTPEFAAVPGRLNEWRLPVPEPLAELVRENISKSASEPEKSRD